MNEERDQRVRELLERGEKKAAVARELGIDRATVSRIAVKFGRPASRRGDDGVDWEQVRSHYVEGNTAADCMRRFGFSAATWKAAIHRGEIEPRPRTQQRAPGRTRQRVARLHASGMGPSEIARELGVATPTVCYHLRKLGVPPRKEFARRYDWEEISRVYEEGASMRECRARFGFSSEAWYAAVARGDIVPRPHLIPLDELLVRGRRTGRSHLKQRLIGAGLKQNRCEECGLTEWRGRPLTMQLHHINGVGDDNRLENLALLCANCHSQTDTWGGRKGPGKGRHLRLVEEDEEAA